MSREKQITFWLTGVLFFIASLYFLNGILLPFVVGMSVAYFLDPVADALERIGFSRTLSVLFILLTFFLLVVAALLLVAPLLQAQLLSFIERLPVYISWVRDHLAPLGESLEKNLGNLEGDLWGERFTSAAKEYAGVVVGWLGGVFSRIWGGGLAILNFLSLVFITPLVAFYLLRDWDLIVKRIDGWLPRAQVKTIRQQLSLIDETLAGFVRGAVLVCLCLAIFYGGMLSLIGLEFGLVIGLICGLISFIPYVWAITGFIAGVTMAFFQFPDLLPVGLVAATFLAGQIMEGNFLTPKLVGERIGLHPLWLVFALLAGGALFGFLGLLLAVPVAAVIGVLVRFGLSRYLKSPLYFGPGGREAASPRRPARARRRG